MGVDEGEEIQTKGTDHLFNKIIAENFPKLEKQMTLCVENTQTHGDRCRKLTEHQTIRTKKKHPQTHHNQNNQHTEQRKNSESCKKKTSDI
jgi:hypothetical protein